MNATEYGTASIIEPKFRKSNCQGCTNFLAQSRWDDLSDPLVGRRGIRDDVVDSKGNGFAATRF